MRRASFASELGDEAQRALDEAAAALPAVAVNVAHGGVSHSPGSGDDDGLATPTMLRQVAAGEHFGALVTGEGRVLTWGRSSCGQLGRVVDASAPAAEPAPVEGLDGVASVSLGADHAAAIVRGTLLCWGSGSFGQLGQGDGEASTRPRVVAGLSHHTVVRVACGWSFTCCVTAEGRVYSWGTATRGQLGHKNGLRRESPARVMPLRGRHIVDISCGEAHTAALAKDGAVYTWGAGSYGQLGHGNERDYMVPHRVRALRQLKDGDRVQQVACGAAHTVALSAAGRVFAWGRGDAGQIGIGTTANVFHPHRVVFGSRDGTGGLDEGDHVASVDAGRRHCVARTLTGALWVWGELRGTRRCSLQRPRHLPGPATPLWGSGGAASAQAVRGATMAACGSAHIVACLRDGTVWTWGRVDTAGGGVGQRGVHADYGAAADKLAAPIGAAVRPVGNSLARSPSRHVDVSSRVASYEKAWGVDDEALSLQGRRESDDDAISDTEPFDSDGDSFGGATVEAADKVAAFLSSNSNDDDESIVASSDAGDSNHVVSSAELMARLSLAVATLHESANKSGQVLPSATHPDSDAFSDGGETAVAAVESTVDGEALGDGGAVSGDDRDDDTVDASDVDVSSRGDDTVAAALAVSAAVRAAHAATGNFDGTTPRSTSPTASVSSQSHPDGRAESPSSSRAADPVEEPPAGESPPGSRHSTPTRGRGSSVEVVEVDPPAVEQETPETPTRARGSSTEGLQAGSPVSVQETPATPSLQPPASAGARKRSTSPPRASDRIDGLSAAPPVMNGSVEQPGEMAVHASDQVASPARSASSLKCVASSGADGAVGESRVGDDHSSGTQTGDAASSVSGGADSPRHSVGPDGDDGSNEVVAATPRTPRDQTGDAQPITPESIAASSTSRPGSHIDGEDGGSARELDVDVVEEPVVKRTGTPEVAASGVEQQSASNTDSVAASVAETAAASETASQSSDDGDPLPASTVAATATPTTAVQPPPLPTAVGETESSSSGSAAGVAAGEDAVQAEDGASSEAPAGAAATDAAPAASYNTGMGQLLSEGSAMFPGKSPPCAQSQKPGDGGRERQVLPASATTKFDAAAAAQGKREPVAEALTPPEQAGARTAAPQHSALGAHDPVEPLEKHGSLEEVVHGDPAPSMPPPKAQSTPPPKAQMAPTPEVLASPPQEAQATPPLEALPAPPLEAKAASVVEAQAAPPSELRAPPPLEEQSEPPAEAATPPSAAQTAQPAEEQTTPSPGKHAAAPASGGGGAATAAAGSEGPRRRSLVHSALRSSVARGPPQSPQAFARSSSGRSLIDDSLSIGSADPYADFTASGLDGPSSPGSHSNSSGAPDAVHELRAPTPTPTAEVRGLRYFASGYSLVARDDKPERGARAGDGSIPHLKEAVAVQSSPGDGEDDGEGRTLTMADLDEHLAPEGGHHGAVDDRSLELARALGSSQQEVATLRRRVAELEGELGALEDEVGNLSSALEDAEEDNMTTKAALDAELQRVRASAQSATRELDALRGDADGAPADEPRFADLRRTLEEAVRMSTLSSRRVVELEARIDELGEQRAAALRSAREEHEGEMQRAQERHQREIAALEGEVARLHEQIVLQKERAGEVEQLLRDSISELSAEQEKLLGTLRSARAVGDAKADELARTHEELESANRRLNEQRRQLEAAAEEASRRDALLETRTNELEGAQQQVRASTLEVAQLRSQLGAAARDAQRSAESTASTHAAELARRDDELRRTTLQLKETERRAELLEAQLLHTEEHSAHAPDDTASATSASTNTAALTDAEARAARAEDSAANARDELARVKLQLQHANDEVEHLRTSARVAASDAQAAILAAAHEGKRRAAEADAGAARAKETVAALTAKLADADAELADLRAQSAARAQPSVVSVGVATEGDERLTDALEEARVLRERLAAAAVDQERLQAALDEAIATRDTALSEREGAEARRAEAVAERDEATAQRDAALEQRDDAAAKASEAVAHQRDEAVAQRDESAARRVEAVTQRDEALAQRDEAVAQRDEAVAQRDEAVAQRDEALAQHDAAAARVAVDAATQAALPAADDAPPSAVEPDAAAPPTPRTARSAAQVMRLEDALRDAASKAANSLVAERKARAEAEQAMRDRYEARFAQLSATLEALEGDLRKAQRRAVDAETALEDEVKRAADDAVATRRRVEEIRELEDARTQQAERIERLEGEATELNKRLADAERRASVAGEQLADSEATRRSERERVDEARQGAARELAAQRVEHDREMAAALAAHAEELRAVRERARGEVVRAEEALAAARRDHDEQVQALTRERAAAEEELRHGLGARVDGAADRIAELESDLAEARARADEAEAEAARVRQQLADEQRRVRAAEEVAVALEAAADKHVDVQEAEAASTVRELTAKHAAEVAALKAQLQDAERAAEERLALEVDKAEARVATATTVTEADHLAATAALEAEAAALRREVRELTADLHNERGLRRDAVTAMRAHAEQAARDAKLKGASVGEKLAAMRGRARELEAALEEERAKAERASQRFAEKLRRAEKEHQRQLQRRVSAIVAASNRSLRDALAKKESLAKPGTRARARRASKAASSALAEAVVGLEGRLPVLAATVGADHDYVREVEAGLDVVSTGVDELQRAAAQLQRDADTAARDCDAAVERAHDWHAEAMRQRERADAAEAAAARRGDRAVDGNREHFARVAAGLYKLSGWLEKRDACRAQAAFTAWSMARVLSPGASGRRGRAHHASVDSAATRSATHSAASGGADADDEEEEHLQRALALTRAQHEREMERLRHERARRPAHLRTPVPSRSDAVDSPIVPRSSRRQAVSLLKNLISTAKAVHSMQQQLSATAAARGDELVSEMRELEAMEAEVLRERGASHGDSSSSSAGQRY